MLLNIIIPPLPYAGKEGKILQRKLFKKNKNIMFVKVFIFLKSDKTLDKTHKKVKLWVIFQNSLIVYEYMDLAAMTLVITSWSLIFFVRGSARLRPVSTNLTVIPTWSTHFQGSIILLSPPPWGEEFSSGKRIQEKREKRRKKRGEGKRGEKRERKRERKRGKEKGKKGKREEKTISKEEET